MKYAIETLGTILSNVTVVEAIQHYGIVQPLCRTLLMHKCILELTLPTKYTKRTQNNYNTKIIFSPTTKPIQIMLE